MSQFEAVTENEDAMRQILLNLPVKDLLCLKCVAKEYNRLISEARFGYLYFCRNLDTDMVAGIFLYQLEWRYHSINNFISLRVPTTRDLLQTPRNPLCSLSFLDANSDIHRMSSCNGLPCLCIVRYGITASYDYYICNAPTNKSIKLPDLNRPSMTRILSMTVAFNRKKSPFYKVVCVWIGGPHFHFSICSSETKHWRDTQTALKVQLDDSYEFSKGVFCFNSVHWVSKMGPFLCFYMDKECFDTMATTPIPQKQETRNINYFGECDGYLYLLVEREVGELQVYCMFRENSKWASVLRLNINVALGVPSASQICYSIHFILRTEKWD